MSRLYDRILRQSRGGKHTPLIDSEFTAYGEEDARDLPDTTVIAADNVSQYFYEVSGNDEWRSGGGFPNVAPPLEQFFMETRRPKSVKDSRGREVDDAEGMPTAWGALFRCEDFKRIFDSNPGWRANAREAFALSTSRLGLDVHLSDPSEDPFEMELEEDIRWIMRLSCYMEDPHLGSIFASAPVRDNIGLVAQQFVAVTEDGQIAHFTDGRRARFVMPMLSGQPQAAHYMAMNARYFAHPFMAAISFMHCKNVHLDLQEPPQKSSAKHHKNHGRPLCSYNLLQIGPMKEVLEGEGRRGEVGLARSFHICRGHFRTYVPERGGPGGRPITEPETQYVSAHARGNRKVGEVHKDYNVNPSGKATARKDKPGGHSPDPAMEAARRASEGNPSESRSRSSSASSEGKEASSSRPSATNAHNAANSPAESQPEANAAGKDATPRSVLGSLKRSLWRVARGGKGPG